MSGAEQISKALQSMDIQRLTKILSEAKNWIQQNRDQARDQLLDSPQLSYALYNIPAILEQRYQDIEAGNLDIYGNPRYPAPQMSQFQNQQAYRTPQMQGVFLDFQSNNAQSTTDNNGNQIPSSNPQQPGQPQMGVPPPPNNYYGGPPPQPYDPQSGYEPQPPQYEQPGYDPQPQYGAPMPQYQYPPPGYGAPPDPSLGYPPPQMNYSYGAPMQPPAYSYDGNQQYETASFDQPAQYEAMQQDQSTVDEDAKADAEIQKIVTGLAEEDILRLDVSEDMKKHILSIKRKTLAKTD